LLERERELQLIDEAIARVREGTGATLVIEGPAGIGKTALLRAARERAGGARLSTLSGAGRELEQGFAFGVARQLFEPALRSFEPAQRETVLSGAAAPAAPLFGEGPEALGPGDTGFALTHALYWLTANLAELRPLLLTVDDLQWADLPSQRTLAYLVPRFEELPVLLACAVRTGDAAAEVLNPLLPTDAPAELLRPAPLSATASGTVVRAAVGTEASDPFCEACHRATGGNPFLARELALAAAEEGVGDDAAGVARLGTLAPPSVSRSVLPRVGRLGPAAGALAQALAVLERAELRQAAELAELDEDVAVDAVEALTEAGVLAAGLPLRFGHPILRTALYEDLSPAARERAHRRAARLLARSDDDAEAAASHLERTEPRGEAWAVDVLRNAGHKALARGSPEAAARALRRALDENVSDGRAALLQELGQAEAAFGDPGAAQRLEAAYEEASDADSRATALAALAETRFVAGAMAPAIEGFRQALDELGERPGSPLEVQLFLGYVMLARAYAPSARDAHDRIRDRTAGGEGDGRLAETARLAALAYDGFLRGQSAAAVRESASLALGDASLLEAGGPGTQAFLLTTWALAGSDGFEPAEAALAGAFDGAGRSGSFLALGMACHHRLWSRWRRGQVLEALADCEIALELAARGWELIRPAAGWARAECLIETGAIAAAEEAIEEIEQLDPGLSGSCVEGWPLMGRSRLELERGNPEPALEAALRCGSIMLALHAENPAVADWRSRAALAAARLGDHGRARELWEEELTLARDFGAPRAIGIALRAGGAIEGGERGIELLSDAVNALEASPAQLERARALTDLGAELRRARRPREAREPLRQGLQLAGQCGASALADRARDELQAAGARPRGEVFSGLGSLTPREYQVAQLAAQGLGNREIAQRLFITRKTVEAHMRNIFRKLDVTAREELAQVLPGA
jgi:DNA-binding CsgD family transcriptional regulator